MKPKNDRCKEHGMYLYKTGFGWSCKLGCYYTDDPQKIKDGFIRQYKEELKDKIYNIMALLFGFILFLSTSILVYNQYYLSTYCPCSLGCSPINYNLIGFSYILGIFSILIFLIIIYFKNRKKVKINETKRIFKNRKIHI